MHGNAFEIIVCEMAAMFVIGLNVLSPKHINKRAIKELLKNGAAVGITGTILCMRLANERQRYSV